MVNNDFNNYCMKKSSNSTYKNSISSEHNFYSVVDPSENVEKNKKHENKKIKVLIVDDNNVNRFITKNVLKLMELSVAEAASGLQAIDMIKNDSYQVAFIDYLMPNMDGLELTKYINTQISEENRPKIICISGKYNDDIQCKFKQAGACAVISKPIEIDVLKNILKEIEPQFQFADVENQEIINEDINYKQNSKNELIYQLISNIPDIDYDKGLYYATGDAIIYMKIIKVTVVNIKQSIQWMNKDASEIKYLDLKREFHSLTSVLMHIGATSLAKNAEQLEVELDKKLFINSKYIDKFVDDLTKLLAALEHAIDAYTVIDTNENQKLINDYEKDIDKNEEIMKRKQATLYHAGRYEYEMMLENIKVLQSIIDINEEEIMKQTIKAAERFEYEKVIELIEETLKN